jgi:branched-chain amino acid transport system permease protein
VVINLLGTYVEVIGNELRLAAALAIIVLVLVVRPSGLFGRPTVQRV